MMLLRIFSRVFGFACKPNVWLIAMLIGIPCFLQSAWSQRMLAKPLVQPILKPTASDEDMFAPNVDHVVIKPGDTLWDLTEQVSGKPWLWPRVWALNPQLTNPHWLFPGQTLRFVAAGQALPEAAESADQVAVAAPSEPVKKPDIEHINAPPQSHTNKLGTQDFLNTTFVTEHELAKSGRLSNAVPDKILLTAHDQIYITFPKQHVPKPLTRFFIHRTLGEVLHPVTHKSWGYMTEITGLATIETTDAEVALARIDSVLREVERGQYVSLLNKDLLLHVDPIFAKKLIRGVILTTESDTVAVGAPKIVFVDKGTAAGLARGHTLRVQSVGDPVTHEKEHLSKIDIATLVVLEVKEKSATCLVLKATRDIWPGDPFYTVVAHE